MADFGSRNSGFFGGTSSGGGGTSTGINGLNGTTNIGLGGTMTGNVTINGNTTNTLYFGQNGNVLLEAYGGVNLICAGPTWSNLIYATQNQDGVQFTSYLSSDTTKNTYFYQSYFRIRTQFNASNYGLNLDFSIKEFTLGDYADLNGKTKIIVDDVSGWVYSKTTSGQSGFFITNGSAFFGLNNSVYSGFGFYADGLSNTLSTRYNSNLENGLSLNFTSFVYKFGGFDIASFDNYIQITDDGVGLQEILFSTQALNFNGANLISGSSGGNSGDHLVITLNGQPYKIALQDP